jgi:hypothetical protein
MLDLEEIIDVLNRIKPLATRCLGGFESWKLRLPKSQHVGLYTDFLCCFFDPEVRHRRAFHHSPLGDVQQRQNQSLAKMML